MAAPKSGKHTSIATILPHAERKPQELDGTCAITFLDAEKRAAFSDRVRIAETRWV